jgi:branched-chain amino acid transport system substrate-binding protein
MHFLILNSRGARLFSTFLAGLLSFAGGLARGAQTIIPAPANPWAATYLYVLDKDTNSIFINANKLFLASIRPLFPEIQTVTNLIGKDDFYLYPADLANKFRADDARVLAGGVPFVTEEANQPVGGVRTTVRVTKIPLRDQSGAVIGLRAVWYSHPQLESVQANGGVDISFPADASIFRLERKDSLGQGSAWVPQSVSSNIVGGKFTHHVASSGPQGFFRLNSGQPVKIGALLSLTGDWSTLGKNCQAAMQIGLETINLDQFSSGSPLYFTADIRDTYLDPATALTQLQSLAAAGVNVVIGPQSSAELRVLKPFADANGILLVSPSSTASSLAFTNDNLFRFCPDDTYEAGAMVALLVDDGVQAVVPIWRDDAGNQGLHDSVARLFPAQGGLVSAGVMYNAGETNFSAAIAALSAQVASALTNHPGKVAVYLAGFDEVAQVFNLARSNSVLAFVKWYGSDGVVQSVPVASNADAAQFAATHNYPCPTFGMDDRYRSVWEPLAGWIKAKSGIDADAFTLAAYDALQVAVAAYRAVGNSASVADLKSAFVQAAGTYTGATGPTLLNAAGDRDGGAFDFWSLKTGTNGFIWYRSSSFEPLAGGSGTITRYP